MTDGTYSVSKRFASCIIGHKIFDYFGDAGVAPFKASSFSPIGVEATHGINL